MKKKKLILRKDILKPSSNSKRDLIFSKRNTIEKEEKNDDDINNINNIICINLKNKK